MKRIAAITVVLVCALSGCALLTPPGDPTTQEREVGDVTAVVLTGGGNLVVTLGSTPSLEITAGENVIERVISETDGDTLTIGPEKGPGLVWGELRYALTVTSLSTLEIRGSGDATIDFAGASDVDVAISGSGDVVGTSLSADTVDVRISGSGDVELAGDASAFSIVIEGSGEFTGDDLRTRTADVEISGSGDVDLFVTELLTATINGSGEVRHTGGATVESEINGAGDISSY